MPAPKKSIKKKKTELNVGLGVSRSLGQGLLFGFADEAEAFARSLVGTEDYQTNLEKVRSELDEFREQAPIAAYGAEILGSIPTALGGAGLLARAGLKGAGKVGAIESGIYGVGAGEGAEDRIQSGLVGAAAGGAITKTASKLLPIKSKTAKDLQKKGIPLTPGQSLKDAGNIGSDLISALEDLSTSYPGVGVPIQAKRLETLIKTNRVLLDEAVEPLGLKIPKNLSGREAYEFVRDTIDVQYENVLEKLSLSNLDNLNNKILDILEESILDASEQTKVLKVVDQSINNKLVNGVLPGKSLKNAQTKFREKAESFSKKGGFEGEVGDTFRLIKKALEDEIDLQNVDAKELSKINNVYRNLLPINDAMQQAIIKEGVFTPSQLLRSIKKLDSTKRKERIVRGKAPLQETAELAEKVIGGTFPDTGTASRLLAQGMIGDPRGLGGIAPEAFFSQLIQFRPFGVSPTTGLLTLPEKTVRTTTPSLTGITSQNLPEELKTNIRENLLKTIMY